MDLKQLDVLVAIADHGTFSAAARSLHTVQSNVSAHVARLERELGVQLVDRTGGGMTDEGELVVARARRVRRELSGVTSDVAALHDEIVGDVRLGVIGTVGRWLLPRLLEAVAERHPRVATVVVDATTTSLLPQLVDRALDLAVVNLPVSDPLVATDELFDEDRIVIAPDDHPLAASEELRLVEVAEHELILEPRGTAFRDELETAAAAAGVELRTRAEVDGMRTVASLAFEGFGPAIVPATAAPHWLEGPWRTIPLVDVAGRSVGLARLRHERLSAPARVMAEEVLRVLADIAEDHPGVRRPRR